MKLEALKAVYSYFFPEVRKLVYFGDTQIPDQLYMTTTSAREAKAILAGCFDPPLKNPETADGRVDLDTIHEPIIDRVVKAYSRIAPALKGFKYRYPMAGSSQGIFHILAELKAAGCRRICVLKGEYEGYAEYAKALGMVTREYDETEIDIPEPGVWFISNPSARDGNIIPNKAIKYLCERGHRIVLDLAYAGMTLPYRFDLSHPNIVAVVMSMSKPYGVFRFRIGGFTFGREPIPSLYANKWFKDVPRLLTALKLVEAIPPGSLYKKYRPLQERIVSAMNMRHGLNIGESDVFLLGHMREDGIRRPEIAEYLRWGTYRFCLTPYFERLERGENI